MEQNLPQEIIDMVIQQTINDLKNKFKSKYDELLNTINWISKDVTFDSCLAQKIKEHSLTVINDKVFEEDKQELRKFLNTVNASNLKNADGPLREYQLRLVDFSQEIIPKFEKDGFHPMLVFGVLLGAIRHNGK